MSKEKQINEMAEVLKAYTKKNNIMASVVILEDYAEQIYNAGYRKQSEGEWIWTESGEEDYEQYWVCSNCKEHEFFQTKFCPNCGSKMKGDSK